MASFAAVDQSVGRVLDTLEVIGATDETFVVLTSDNGLLLGEHGRGDKRIAYEESIRIPLLASGARVRDAGRVASELVLNIDLAPTLLQLAGVPIPLTMQGRSLVPILADEPSTWRESFLYEYFQEPGKPAIPRIRGVRTQNWKYTQFPDRQDIEELYHLATDPHELENLAADPEAQAKLIELRVELERLSQEFT